MTTKEALRKIKKVHGEKYKIIDGWEYKNAKSDITLYCPEHGEFHKDFYRLVNLRQGCPTCSYGFTHKPYGYWNNRERCFEEAKKYKNKYELERKCLGCYNAAKSNGWLDEIADTFYDNSIHYMGYDEPINCVYVYEYKDLNSFYVGRTNNIKRRHRQHCKGYGHSDGARTYDIVYTFAKENGIEIPEPIILEENLTAEESQDKENYWKIVYTEKGMNCLNKASTGIGKGSLGATIKWTYDKFCEEALKYTYKMEMKSKNQSAYKSGVQNGWINEFFKNRKKDDNYWNNLDNILNAAKECTGARDMIKKFGGAYNSAKKNGWIKLLKYGKKA